MGAKQTISIDLNPYLKEELVQEALNYIAKNKSAIKNTFGGLIDDDRLNLLVKFGHRKDFSLDRFLELCNIHYIAPGDATKTNLPTDSIDFHTSYTVFEHIPPSTVKEILLEGNRIVKDGGLFIHRIDYTDHFSHSDKTISPINFLQYSETKWNFYAGNRYMYMNRLRHDDFISIFNSAGHTIISDEMDKDESILELLRAGDLNLDGRFSKKSNDILSITASWIISKKG
jgi:SAM-dependent methyltransferase